MIADAAGALVAAGATASLGPHPGTSTGATLGLVLLAPLAWVAATSLTGGYEKRLLGNGPEEFRRISAAAGILLAATVGISWGLRLELGRGFVLAALGLIYLLTVAQRRGQRQWLHRQRELGRALRTTLLVGHRNGVAAAHGQLARETHHGYQVVGCCLPAGFDRSFDGLPVLGDLDTVMSVVDFYEVDVVAVLPTPEMDGGLLRRLGWDLEHTGTELLLAPAVTDLAGPWLGIRPCFGLPLLHAERPELRGARRLVKEVFDRTVAVIGLVAALPALVAIAMAVRASGPGPVLVREARLGHGGKVFDLLTFRTTTTSLEPTQGDGALRERPLTPVGCFLRRHALDELPQLLHVLRGQMSIVGPRPRRPGESGDPDVEMRRRLPLKPGLTGLWQLSGRSDLSWEDAVRLELRYVETWSLISDLTILAGAVREVFRRDGAL